MKLFRCIATSFSEYSQIPVPRFYMDEEDQKYSLMFFPLIGVLIGFAEVVTYQLCRYFDLHHLAMIMIMVVLPVAVTGGIHISGFMYTVEAIRSGTSREEKLKMLAGRHTGAFSVIRLISAMMVFAAAAMVIFDKGDYFVMLNVGVSFVFSRSLGGLLSFILPQAYRKGKPDKESKRTTKIVVAVLFAWYILALAAVFVIDPQTALLTVAVYMGALILYRDMTDKEFGGVTKDTAGYFITVSELCNIILLAMLCLMR